MRSLGSPASVSAAIRDDADAEVERIERECRAATDRLAAVEDTGATDLPEREARLAAARRDARERLAHEDLLDAREALEAREAWMRRALDEGHRRLAEPETKAARKERIVRLAREGTTRLSGASIEVLVAADDAAILDEEAARAIDPSRAVRFITEPRLGRGGCVVREPGGKVSFDNTLDARARRFEAAWRVALGALYGGGAP